MTPSKPSPAVGRSVDPEEIARFSALADAWWDSDGAFRPLHKFNPVRLRFLRDRIAAHWGRNPVAERPLDGLTLLDVGCGGGLLAEPMTRLGAAVTGIDASEKNIGVARTHAATMKLDIDYRVATVEDMAEEKAAYDVVLNMEIVEHVADLRSFVAASAAVLAPGGLMVVATLNRTLKAFGLAIVGAEYVLRWLPRGTHDWRKFVRPSELEAAVRRAGLDVVELTGVTYNPLSDAWALSKDVDVNYMMVAAYR